MQKDEISYRDQVLNHGGKDFGETNQGQFIEKANQKIMAEKGTFIQSLSNYFLKRPIFEPCDLLNSSGICNGLVQAFYLKLKYATDKEKAIEEFAAELDNVDLSLARRANKLQSIDSDTYEHVSHHHFNKTLGLDFEEEKTFTPYKDDGWEKFANKFFKDSSDINKTTDSPSIDSSSVYDYFIKYLEKQPEDDLIKITLEFSNPSRAKSSIGICHVIYFSKMKNTNGEMLFVFYDPNKTPTVFKDQAKFNAFLKSYLNETTLSFKNGFAADYATITAIKYTENSQFHTLMRTLEKEINSKLTDEKTELQQKLRTLKLKCIYADKYGMSYDPKTDETKVAKIDDLDFEVIEKDNEPEGKHYSNGDLLDLIQNYIENELEYEPEISADLLTIIDPDFLPENGIQNN